MQFFRIALVFGALCSAVAEDDGLAYEYTVLCARNSTGSSRNFCSASYPGLKEPSSQTCDQNIKGYGKIVNFLDGDVQWDPCTDEKPSIDVAESMVVLNHSTKCLDTQIKTLEDSGAKGILFVTYDWRVPILRSNITSTKLTVTAITSKTLDGLKFLGEDIEANVYLPRRGFDPSLLVVFAMAVFSVAVGAFWSGHYRHRLYTKMSSRLDKPRSAQPSAAQHAADKAPKREEEAVSIDLSPVMVIILVLAMCGMLVLLYFFYAYLIYAILAVYCFAATFGLSVCLNKLFEPIKCCSWRVTCCNFSWFKDPQTGQPASLEVRKILLLIVSASVTIVWVVFRHKSWAWILQDFLGIAFSINLLRVIRLGSLRIITLLLGLLFFYDIFFVFITPYFTNNGSSVMVQVATGGDSSGIGEGGRAREPLPMVLKVPHLGSNPLSVCFISNASLLGFGDILCPGLLVSYCHYFDMRRKIRFRLYYVVEVICYSLGMVATFISLFLMEEAQPALLYLVPFTVIPAIILSLCRGEFKELWNGDDESENQINSCNSSQNGDDSGLSDAEAGSDDDQKFEVRTDTTTVSVGPRGDAPGENVEGSQPTATPAVI